MKAAEIIGVVMAVLALGCLLELARDKGVLIKSLGVAFIALVAGFAGWLYVPQMLH